MAYDDILDIIGQFGKYQRRQYVLLFLPGVLLAFNMLSAVFLANTPKYRCALPETLWNGTDTYSIQNDAHKQAIIRYMDVGEQTVNSTSLTFTDSCHPRDSEELCPSYVYSQNDLTSTIITQWDLVCDPTKVLQGTLSSVIYTCGVLVGAFVFGVTADILGRKKNILITLLIQGVFGLITAFSPEYYSFVVFRFIVGAASAGNFMTLFVLGMELCGPKYRIVSGIVIQYSFAVGYLILGGLAYAIRQWKYIQIAISIPSFVFLIYFWFLTESARWLVTRGRIAEAEKIVRHTAEVNGATLPDDLDELLQDKTMIKESILSVRKSWALTWRMLVLLINWFVVHFGYYYFSLNSGSFGSSMYIAFLLGGVVEFPGYTVGFATFKLGRKPVFIFCMLMSGLSSVGIVIVELYAKDRLSPEAHSGWLLALNSIAKLGMSTTLCVIWMWSAEIYPTSIRNSMMGLSDAVNRTGVLAAYWIAELGKFVPDGYQIVVPAGITAALVILGGLLAIPLPETYKSTMPETIEESIALVTGGHRTDESDQSSGKSIGEAKF